MKEERESMEFQVGRTLTKERLVELMEFLYRISVRECPFVQVQMEGDVVKFQYIGPKRKPLIAVIK